MKTIQERALESIQRHGNAKTAMERISEFAFGNVSLQCRRDFQPLYNELRKIHLSKVA